MNLVLNERVESECKLQQLQSRLEELRVLPVTITYWDSERRLNWRATMKDDFSPADPEETAE
jgi:hypothetical protein